MKTKMIHKTEVKVGDTVIHNGELKTVGIETFGEDEFMGLLLWGDSYRCGYKMVELVEEVRF